MPNARVPKLPQSLHPRLTPAALEDVRKVLRWSERNFGKSAAKRYEMLIVQAVRDVTEAPLRPGSRSRPELMLSDARTYHINFSKPRMPEPRVHEPRHIILYRITGTGKIEIARILHDSRDLALHLPEAYRL